MALTVTYDGSTILSLSGSADYKLLTNGKMMDSDVLLQYTAIPIEETTATANDVYVGKYFFTSSGVKTQGVALPAYTLITEEDVTVTTTSTTDANVTTISAGSAAYTNSAIIYVKVRDKAGPRNGYFIGSDAYFFNAWPITNPGQAAQQFIVAVHRKDSNGNVYTYGTGYQSGNTTGYGVYAKSIGDGGVVSINRRSNSSYSLSIDGTYNVQVYSIPYAPTQGNPYSYSFT